jgi:hypothetical protein
MALDLATDVVKTATVYKIKFSFLFRGLCHHSGSQLPPVFPPQDTLNQ